jgi:hypothetical protein
MVVPGLSVAVGCLLLVLAVYWLSPNDREYFALVPPIIAIAIWAYIWSRRKRIWPSGGRP